VDDSQTAFSLGTALGLFSSNYTFYFMLSWLPTYLQTERGFSLIAMSQLATLAFAVNAVSAFTAGWAIDRFLARGGSANIGYKSVMAVAHVGSVVCMLAMAVGSPKLALVSVFVYQALCGASSPGVYAMCQILAGRALPGDGWEFKTPSAISRGSSRHGSRATSSKAPGISRTPSWWLRQ